MTRGLLAGLAFALAASAAAKDIRVAEDGSGDFKKLSKALEAAAPGDVIVIKNPAGMVGVLAGNENGQTVIAGTVAGSPAEAAGLKKGERMIAVDGSPLQGLPLPEVVAKIRGPVGTTVRLRIAGDSGEREVAIVRGEMRREVLNDASKMSIAADAQDYETAAGYAKPLAEGGDVSAQAHLAFAYYNALGVGKNFTKAHEWAVKAAEGGNPAAQRLLAEIYRQGQGAKKDLAQFVYWNRKAAEKGDGHAMLNLGFGYEFGWGVPADQSTALGLYQAALKTAMPASVLAQAQSSIARLENLNVVAKPFVVSAPVVAATVQSVAAIRPRSDVDELPPARASDPKAVALVIGVERYREALPKADFAAADARLAADYFKRVLGVQDENLALLVDERATRTDLAKHIEQWLPNHAEKDGKVYVYFSGHGAPEPAKGDSYLVPYDADPAYIKQTGYSLKSLYAQLGKLPAKSVVVMMDSCFSGAGGRSVLAKGARPLVTVKTDVPPAKVTVIAASAAEQISNSYQEQGHGLFTYFLLKGLKEKGDLKGAFDYLGPEVSRVARRRYNSDQTPQWREGK